MKRRLAPYLVIMLGIAFLYVGTLPENEDVTRSRNISSVVCLSCLGLTGTTSDELTIDDFTRMKYTTFNDNINIYIFSTETCKSCPRVINMCNEIAKFTDKVSVEEIKFEDDVERFRELAERYGSQAENVGVPWIVVADEDDGEYESWLYESYLEGYPTNDMRYIVQVIDMVIKFGTTTST
ncbi:MAG TPA: hypothetical protein ENN11_04835 [Methanomicrobia archaeon]|nr:hypothetical protein [Methanomicrobia archaeon]